ncbi:MAG: peptidoglycan editing factor PgeF [Rhodoferax sp.]|nr:peptidoglycan editing factor PgeF [Rhodoferax sp.]
MTDVARAGALSAGAPDLPGVLVPDWPLPPGVRACVTSRQGGVSLAPFDSFNLGSHVEDQPHSVAANRQRLARAIGARPVFLTQVHGSKVQWLGPDLPDGAVADAAVTDRVALACTVLVADCLPVLVASRCGSRVGAAHAGWRGLAGSGGHGILEQFIQSFRAPGLDQTGFDASQLIAWLGPCIGPEAFEVGADVRDAFLTAQPDADRHFRSRPGLPDNKWWADLPGLARDRLRALGVGAVHGNDGSPGWCTVTQGSRFFSHRRDRTSGRLAACIWRVAGH